MYNDDPVKVGEWIGTLILTAIPLLGIILLFVWAFGGTKPSKQNYAKAVLILAAVSVILTVLYAFLGSFSFANLVNYGY